MSKLIGSRVVKYLLLTFLIVLSLFLPIYTYSQPVSMSRLSDPIELTDGWQYRLDDSGINDKGIPIWMLDDNNGQEWKKLDYPGAPKEKINNYVWVRVKLPDVKATNQSLFFKSEDQIFEVYFDKNRIYSYGKPDHSGNERAPGSPWHIITLPDGFQGKTIFFRMHSIIPYSAGRIIKAQIGSERGHIERIVKDSLGSVVLGFLCMFIGLFLILIFFFEKAKEKSYISLGAFSISIGAWIISETDLKQILFNEPKIWQNVAFMSSYFMPIAFCLFIIQTFSGENTLLIKWLLRIHVIFAVLAFAFDIFNMVQIIFTLRPFLLLLMCTMISSLVISVRAALKGSFKAKIFVLGYAFLCLFSVYDILGWHFKVIPWSKHVTHWGMLLFIISLVYITVKRFAEVKGTLNEVIEHDKTKTEFFTNISHELRTPLNIILGSVQLLSLYKSGKVAVDNEAIWNKHLRTMKQNCLRLIRLVNNLIDITKIDSGFLSLYLQNYDIVSLTEDITMSAADYIKSKGIALVFDTDIEEKIIACDPHKIERIVLNLLSNAVKFTKPGGEIFVNINDLGENVLITVSDTGIGISQDKLEVIFERFKQADNSLSRNYEGSGIGLSLVRSLVEMHEGKITVKSDVGKGSSFCVCLPVRTIQTLKSEEHKAINSSQQSPVERIDIEFSDLYFTEK